MASNIHSLIIYFIYMYYIRFFFISIEFASRRESHDDANRFFTKLNQKEPLLLRKGTVIDEIIKNIVYIKYEILCYYSEIVNSALQLHREVTLKSVLFLLLHRFLMCYQDFQL